MRLIIDLIHLPLRAVSTGELAPEALKAAMAHGITAYDAATSRWPDVSPCPW